MSAVSGEGASGEGSSIRTTATSSVRGTLRRGLALSPELASGLGVTLALAVVATGGRVAVPVTVQQSIDTGINAAGGVDVARVALLATLASVAVVLTAVASYAVNVRLFRSSEAGLATLRTSAFRHVHDLSVLTQSTERRGALVSRVTSDVDTISAFVQFGGLVLIVATGQIAVATVLMLVYSPVLAAVVWLTVLPLVVGLRPLQRVLSRFYDQVRERFGTMLGAVSEAVVGADTIRAYAAEGEVQDRIDTAVDAHRRAAIRSGVLASTIFAGGTLAGGMAVAAVLAAGLLVGPGGSVTLGELVAFLFIVQLFVAPVQIATEVLNELQNAVAGWRRVIAVLDTPADVADPAGGAEAREVPGGSLAPAFEDVSYAYPGGPVVLQDVTLELPARRKVAIVGETGSGKTTLARLLTRLQDPRTGRVLLNGVDLRAVPFAELRRRVVLVPQEGFLFDTTVRENIRFGRPEAGDDAVDLAVTELGLTEWAAGLPHGLDTRVGQRGESLSAGERQLVAVARAYLADPDLLVLDEATSAVDPATEVRLQRALEGLTRGRTSVAIAHRLSTAENADLVVVVDAGRVVEVGRHTDLAGAGGTYSRLYGSWLAQRTSHADEGGSGDGGTGDGGSGDEGSVDGGSGDDSSGDGTAGDGGSGGGEGGAGGSGGRGPARQEADA